MPASSPERTPHRSANTPRTARPASPVDARPILTIAIPAHDEARWIGRCLSAVIAEVGRARRSGTGSAFGDLTTADAIEIVVIDNASRDATAAVAALHSAAAAAAGARLRVIVEPTKGLTHARQAGHAAARGTFVAWVDADTEMPPGWIDRALAIFARSDAIVCASGPYDYRDLPRIRRGLVRAWWWLVAAPSYRLTGYMAVGGNFAVRRAAVDAIGGFDTRIAFFGEDTDIARRLSSAGRVVFDLGLVMPTSARRLEADGFLRTGWRYASNFVAEVLLKRPLDTPYRDVR